MYTKEENISQEQDFIYFSFKTPKVGKSLTCFVVRNENEREILISKCLTGIKNVMQIGDSKMFYVTCDKGLINLQVTDKIMKKDNKSFFIAKG